MNLQEKCLAKIDEQMTFVVINDDHWKRLCILLALRSVLVRHRVGINEGEHHCIDCERDYPCPELRDIAKELEVRV